MQLVGKNREMQIGVVKDPAELRTLLDPVRWRILRALAEEPRYASQLARDLHLDEQKVHYHMNQLRRTGSIKVVRTEEKHGAIARFYHAKNKAYGIVLKDDWSAAKSAAELPSFLDDFYEGGSLNARIVVGSPDPHGPHQARARDTHHALDLALFLGMFSKDAKPSVALDTEVREKELEENNLIIIGGPVTNLLQNRVNKDLPVNLKPGELWSVFSKKSGKEYTENAGMIVKAASRWNPEKRILVLAGTSKAGTRAAILGVTLLGDKLKDSNVVEGIDLDGDGVVDSVKLKE